MRKKAQKHFEDGWLGIANAICENWTEIQTLRANELEIWDCKSLDMNW